MLPSFPFLLGAILIVNPQCLSTLWDVLSISQYNASVTPCLKTKRVTSPLIHAFLGSHSARAVCRIPRFQLHRSFLSSAQRLKRKMKFDNQEIPTDYHTAEVVSAIVGNALVIFSFMKQTYRLEDDKKTAIYVRVLNVLAFLLGAW
ncbi:hypothetical protein MRB53_014822 [Persea americana]|uniref:Uncharacterized protein n=1 Tax=Persea americana TaxID=3435 RepID=A0ACC2KC97_PERAE|nr:hypothetical protein MRB53_014822 [Persea americana]